VWPGFRAPGRGWDGWPGRGCRRARRLGWRAWPAWMNAVVAASRQPGRGFQLSVQWPMPGTATSSAFGFSHSLPPPCTSTCTPGRAATTSDTGTRTGAPTWASTPPRSRPAGNVSCSNSHTPEPRRCPASATDQRGISRGPSRALPAGKPPYPAVVRARQGPPGRNCPGYFEPGGLAAGGTSGGAEPRPPRGGDGGAGAPPLTRPAARHPGHLAGRAPFKRIPGSKHVQRGSSLRS